MIKKSELAESWADFGKDYVFAQFLESILASICGPTLDDFLDRVGIPKNEPKMYPNHKSVI